MKFPELESRTFKPDGEGFLNNFRRDNTPKRVYNMELFHDEEIVVSICDRYSLLDNISLDDEFYEEKRSIAFARFCGFDYVKAGVCVEFQHNEIVAEDTAEMNREGGRVYVDEHKGPIMSWDDFHSFKWPDPEETSRSKSLEWYEKNLPDDMCVVGGLGGHIFEEISWLMGYETMCYALFENRELIKAIADKVFEITKRTLERTVSYKRVKICFSSDDFGYKTGLMISPDDFREFVLDKHKELSRIAHDAGCLYFLHSCGKLDDIMDDLINDVKIDAKHSFEDTIEDIRDVKRNYGGKISLIGGVDIDFLCRSSEEEIRKRVRETLDVCLEGGGYCLGTGNSVANYIPIDNYLAMVDEGMRYGK